MLSGRLDLLLPVLAERFTRGTSLLCLHLGSGGDFTQESGTDTSSHEGRSLLILAVSFPRFLSDWLVGKARAVL